MTVTQVSRLPQLCVDMLTADVSDRALRVWMLRTYLDDRLTRNELADRLGCSRGSVDRALAELHRVTGDAIGAGQRVTGDAASRARASQRAFQASKSLQGELLEKALPPLPPQGGDCSDIDATARGIAQRVWDARTPKPTTPFVAALRLTKTLLAAGWTPDEIETVMRDVPTIATGWMESRLHALRKSRGRQTKVDVDRGGPVGRIQL